MVIKNPENLKKFQEKSQYNQMSLATFKSAILKEMNPRIRKQLYTPCAFHLYFEPIETTDNIYYRLCIYRSKQVTTTPDSEFHDISKEKEHIKEEEGREPPDLHRLKYTDSLYVVGISNYRNRIVSKQYKAPPKMYSQQYQCKALEVYFELFPLDYTMARRIGRNIKV